MTEYDLTVAQLEDVLRETARATVLKQWPLVIDYAEEIMLLAKHLQLLHNAPRANNAHQTN